MFFYLKNILFIYLREGEHGGGRVEGEREADFLLSREPALGPLRPDLSHPGTPEYCVPTIRLARDRKW